MSARIHFGWYDRYGSIYTQCGSATLGKVTEDREAVTCKRCLAKLAKEGE